MFEPDHRVTTEDAEGFVEVEVVADEDLRLGLDQLGELRRRTFKSTTSKRHGTSRNRIILKV